MTAAPAKPAGSNTVNSFIMTQDATALITFLTHVFDAVEVTEARTLDTDGLVLHSEILIGDSMITIADRKPRWPFTPAFNRVYVDDIETTLARARELGADIVTTPTEFFGDVLSRIQDPQGNLWWIYKHEPTPADASHDWTAADNATSTNDAGWESFASPELDYIHSTLIHAMESLKDPRD
jgi:PhnB protein